MLRGTNVEIHRWSERWPTTVGDAFINRHTFRRISPKNLTFINRLSMDFWSMKMFWFIMIVLSHQDAIYKLFQDMYEPLILLSQNQVVHFLITKSPCATSDQVMPKSFLITLKYMYTYIDVIHMSIFNVQLCYKI